MSELTHDADCVKEPIHLLGMIQPSGLLFSVQRDTLQLEHVSKNVLPLLGHPVSEFLRLRLQRIFTEESHAVIKEILIRGPRGLLECLNLQVYDFGGCAVDARVIVHGTAAFFIFELELGKEAQMRMPKGLSGIDSYPDRRRTLEVFASLVRRISHYDRVMIYEFDCDYNGMVTIEDRESDIPSYLHHHFPAGDIPEQARALYEKNLIRVIDQGRAVPVALESVSGETLDLSDATFRAVSPVHLEYLQNMGVASSMSFSLLEDGKLVGLVACHAITPRFISLTVRSVFLHLLNNVNARIHQFTHLEDAQRQREAQEVSAADQVSDKLEKLKQFLGADAVLFAGKGQSFQASPALSVELMESLTLMAAGQEGIITRSGPLPFPGIAYLKGPRGDQCFVLRKEWIETIQWGGNPYTGQNIPFKGGRIGPRKSFGTYEEVQKNKARNWSRTDLKKLEILKTLL